MPELEEPECRYGYTAEQVKRIVDDLEKFNSWMRGQTVMLCDGRRYDHETKEHVSDGCGPHGMIVYASDLRNYLRGGPILD